MLRSGNRALAVLAIVLIWTTTTTVLLFVAVFHSHENQQLLQHLAGGGGSSVAFDRRMDSDRSVLLLRRRKHELRESFPSVRISSIAGDQQRLGREFADQSSFVLMNETRCGGGSAFFFQADRVDVIDSFKHPSLRSHANASCSSSSSLVLVATELSTGDDDDDDTAGFRLPFYDSFGSTMMRIYACRAISQFLSPLPDDDFMKQCAYDDHFTLSTPDIDRMKTWMKSSESGRFWMDCFKRLNMIHENNVKLFRLSRVDEWKRFLPSEAQHSAQPDVNSYRIEIPPPSSTATATQALLAANCIVERNGRIITSTNQVFYPKRAPYSHISLMEKFTNREKTKFVPELDSRTRFIRNQRAFFAKEDHGLCMKQFFFQPYDANDWFISSCPSTRGNDDKQVLLVKSVLVLSQTLADQMFHFFCEVLPRIGSFFDFLDANPETFIHASCDSRARGYCYRVFELLGFNQSRMLKVRDSHKTLLVGAKLAIIPEGGRRHWPLSNIRGILAVRKRILTRNTFANDRESCFPDDDDPTIRILIIKRKLTRLSHVSEAWYDRLRHDLLNQSKISLLYDVKLKVDFFDDRDERMMNDLKLQIERIRSADIVIGAHGAAMSLMMFAKTCTHFISFRSRVNSDVFEHLAIGLGIPFHHILFRNSYELLRDRVIESVGDSLLIQFRKMLPRYLNDAVLVCDECSPATLKWHLRYFRHVIQVQPAVTRNRDSENILENVHYVPKNKSACEEDVLLDYVLSSEIKSSTIVYTRNNIMFAWNEDFASTWVYLPRFDVIVFTQAMNTAPSVVVIQKQWILGRKNTRCMQLVSNSAEALVKKSSSTSVAVVIANVAEYCKMEEFFFREGLLYVPVKRWMTNDIPPIVTSSSAHELIPAELEERNVLVYEAFVKFSRTGGPWYRKPFPRIVLGFEEFAFL